MKKYLLFLGIIGLFALTACGKQAKMSDVTIDYGSSSIYSKEDMDAAIKAIKTVFKDFDGCELHSISYSSDDQCNTPIFILRKMAAVHGILMKNIPAGNGGWLVLMAVSGS